jgi:hypothetical protein
MLRASGRPTEYVRISCTAHANDPQVKEKAGKGQEMRDILLGLESWLISTWRRLLLRKKEDMLATSRMKMGVSLATKKFGKNRKCAVWWMSDTAQHQTQHLPTCPP